MQRWIWKQKEGVTIYRVKAIVDAWDKMKRKSVEIRKLKNIEISFRI